MAKRLIHNTAFWSVLIAGTALILSQLPPILSMLKGETLDVGVSRSIYINHGMGRVSIAADMTLGNAGGDDLWIAEMDGVVFCPSGKTIPINAESVVSPVFNPSTQTLTDLPMGEVSLKPGENWNSLVRFSEYTTEEVISRQNDIMVRLQKNITLKYEADPSKYKDAFVEADPNLVGRAIEFFESQFKLSKGTHKLMLLFKAPDGRVICKRAYEFTLDAYHIQILRQHLQGYKYGYGVYIEAPRNRPVMGRLKLLSTEDAESLYTDWKRLIS